jgi:hypothetical protein
VLDDLAQKDVGIGIPGHGAQGNGRGDTGQRAYLADMINQVRAGTRVGVGGSTGAGDRADESQTVGTG